MRTLFEMDKKNYDSSGKVFYRPSVRSIIIRGGRVAMVHSLMYDYYKFPGGGIESGETRHQALIRETAEESGLCVVPDSIQEYGCVRRIEKNDKPHLRENREELLAEYEAQLLEVDKIIAAYARKK